MSHHGHNCDPAHLRIASRDRLKVGSKIKNGITCDRIIDGIRSNVYDKVDRIHLITKNDASNIQRSFGLHTVERHPDDATSLADMIEDLKKDTDERRSALLYKFQSDTASNPESNLDRRDVMIVIQTSLQKQMFKAFGHNRAVCMDATHGTNIYIASI